MHKKEHKAILGEEHFLDFIINPDKSRTYHLMINAFDDTPQFYNQLNYELLDCKPTDYIECCINSDGGLISEGKIIINALQETSAYITTLIQSRAFSMGAILFCTGHTRIIYENSELMYHNYSSGIYGKGSDMEKRMLHMKEHLGSFIRSNIIGITEDEIKNMMNSGEEFWFNAEEMAKRNICTHISIEGSKIPSDVYLDLLKKTRKEVKKVLKKRGEKYHKKMIPTLISALTYDVDILGDYIQQEHIRIQKTETDIRILQDTL